jgi:3-oxoacyl-[acyl-carrier protein] reductase|tara:strand:- start:533 stop:736 length:204 start_codon:yes stop_codon:yes gene_type:complete
MDTFKVNLFAPMFLTLSIFAQMKERRIAMIPMKRMGTPGEVADDVYYLGSGKNRFITNEIVTISGGE